MIYLISFLLTVVLLYLAGKSRGVLALALSVCGLMIPCVIAGLRDETIGVDVLSYAKWMYLDAGVFDLPTFLSYESSVASFGWNLFTWVSTRLLKSFSGYLFAIELLCIAPVYLGLRRIARGTEWAGIGVWLLLVYGFSMNGMRQTAAMGFVFFAVSYIETRNPMKFLASVFVAFLFHQTAIICIAFYPLATSLAYKDSLKRFFGKWIWFAVVSAVVITFCIILVCGPVLVRALSSLKASYAYQVEHLGENDVSISALYMLIALLICWGYSKRDYSEQVTGSSDTHFSKQFSYLYALAYIGCVAWQLNYVSSTLGRLGFYGFCLIPYIAQLYVRSGSKGRSYLTLITGISLLYFIVMILILGNEGVYPYSSSILDSLLIG